MKQILAAFAILALAAPAARADETEHVSRTITLPQGGALELKTFSGRVHITAVDGNQVTVDAERRGSRRALDRTRLDIYVSGSTVYVNANHHDHSWFSDNVVENDLDIRVPRHTNLHITSFSAPIDIEDVAAQEVTAHTFSGRVGLRLPSWQEHQEIDVKTFSGRVELHVPADARGHVDFESFSGRLNSDVPLTLHSSGRRRVSAELGSGGSGSLHLHSFSGSVKILR